MMQFRRILLLNLLKLSDIINFIGGFVFSYLIVTRSIDEINLVGLLNLEVRLIDLVLLAGVLFSWHLLFSGFGLYRSRRLTTKLQDFIDIVKATTTGSSILYIGGTLLGVEIVTIQFAVIFWLVITLFTISYRILLKYLLKILRRRGRNLRYILIIGTNERAYKIEKRMNENRDLGYSVRGYVDDTIYQPREDMTYLGKIDDLPKIIRNMVVDEIFIALPIKSHYETIQKIIQYSEVQGIVPHYLSHYFKTNNRIIEQSTISGFPISAVISKYQQDTGFLIKRGFDLVIASILIVLTMPIMIAAAVAIVLTTPGAIIFVQNRVGLNKRIFRMYKFRTMVANAESLQTDYESMNEMDGPVFKIHNDPRITRVGKWLRKASIDELPQLINVLKGDMSIVGPRPLPVRDYKGFAEDWQRRRFSVRPGLTCLWQISGRNDISFGKWMELDMEYIDKWSLWLDITIVLKTIPIVFKGSGAS